MSAIIGLVATASLQMPPPPDAMPAICLAIAPSLVQAVNNRTITRTDAISTFRDCLREFSAPTSHQ